MRLALFVLATACSSSGTRTVDASDTGLDTAGYVTVTDFCTETIRSVVSAEDAGVAERLAQLAAHAGRAVTRIDWRDGVEDLATIVTSVDTEQVWRDTPTSTAAHCRDRIQHHAIVTYELTTASGRLDHQGTVAGRIQKTALDPTIEMPDDLAERIVDAVGTPARTPAWIGVTQKSEALTLRVVAMGPRVNSDATVLLAVPPGTPWED